MIERCNLGSNMLEIIDCQRDIGGKYGCPKYNPQYERDCIFSN